MRASSSVQASRSERPPNAARRPRDFLAKIASPTGFEVLFEHLSDVYFFVKDGDGRFVRVNSSFLKLVGAKREEEVLGSRDSDFFPAGMADGFRRDDREVMESRQPIVDKIELARNPEGGIYWFCTTKLPLFDASGAAIGVCGVTRDVKEMKTTNARFLTWAPVLELMLNDYAQSLSNELLARKACLSVSQFNRLFRRKFQTTPQAYLTNIRLNAACSLLVTTDLPISVVALQTGFYDQSHFTNQFVRHHGLPPSQYRKKYSDAHESTPLVLVPASSVSDEAD